MSQVVVIPDPELLLPDEGNKFPPGSTLIASSSYFGGEYSSLSALVERRKRVEAQLSIDLQDWQRDMELPLKVVYSVRNDVTGERLMVFGDIPDVERLAKSERADGIMDLAHLRRLRRRVENALSRGWLYGKWHSRTVPDGEWGVVHKRFVQSPMSDAEFESFRAKGWVTGDEHLPT